MTRTCAAPNCTTSLEGMRESAVYCSGACRARDWKERTDYQHPRSENARNGDFWRKLAAAKTRQSTRWAA